MPKVFLSYSSCDQAFADSVLSHLKKWGIDVWRDKNKLRAGETWREPIEGAIATSDALIVLVSPQSSRSAYVNFEWAYALGRGTRVIPVLMEPIDGADLHPRLADLHRFDFTQPGARNWKGLLDEVNRTDSPGPGTFLAQDFPPDYRHDVERCEELWLAGVSLRDTVETLGPVLKSKLAQGHRVAVLLAEPVPSVVEAAARRTADKEEHVQADTEDKCREIERTITRLFDLDPAENASSRLDVRTTKYPLGYGIHGINIGTNRRDGVLYVKLYPYKAQERHKPRFVLRKGRDRWYQSFERELLALWADGTIRSRPFV